MTEKTKQRIWSKLDGVSVLIIIVCILIWLVPKLIKLPVKGKVQNEKQTMTRIFDAQLNHYQKHGYFLALPQSPVVPSARLQPSGFDQPPWSDLDASLPESVHYSFDVSSQSFNGQPAFEITAQGDMDGDGQLSLFKMRGYFNAQGDLVGRDLIYALDPLE